MKPIIEIHYSNFRVTDNFFKILTRLDLVCKTPSFCEYKHRSQFQIYLRIPHTIKTGDQVYCFIEPQINLSKSIREDAPAIKLQLTICKYNSSAVSQWHKSKSIGHVTWDYDDLIKYLGACQYWTNEIAHFLYDQPEFEFTSNQQPATSN